MKNILSVGIILITGILLGILGFSIWGIAPQPTESISWNPTTQWITTKEQTYRFYARDTFNIPATVQGGWLRISADNDFLLYVNGKLIAMDDGVINNSFGLGTRIKSDHNQSINDSLPYRASYEPQFLQSNEKDWKITYYADLSPYLNTGKNVIAVHVQKSQKSPRFILEGEVYPTENSTIKLYTGNTSWRVSTISENNQSIRWFDVDFFDGNWLQPLNIEGNSDKTYSRISPRIFNRLLQGNWISGEANNLDEIWFNKKWNIDKISDYRSFFRFTGMYNYAIIINGKLVYIHPSAQNNQLKTLSSLSGQNNQLHIYEVSNFLQKGINDITIRVSKTKNLDNNQNISALKFFLDGWIEDKNHRVLQTIETDSTWKYFSSPISKENKYEGLSIYSLGSPNAQSFRRTFEGNAFLLNYPIFIFYSFVWVISGIILSSGFSLYIANLFISKSLIYRENYFNYDFAKRLELGSVVLLPSAMFLVIIGLFKHRYAESDKFLIFSQSNSNLSIFIIFITILGITLVYLFSPIVTLFYLKHIRSKHLRSGYSLFYRFLKSIYNLSKNILNYFKSLCLKIIANEFFNKFGFLAVITLLGFYLRNYKLDSINLFADESTSLDAINGILRTGAPESVSGIWYTRSPAYHYMLAIWLMILGNSSTNARFLSVIWGTATLVVAFVLSQKVTKSYWIALLTTLILAIDPWEVLFSRFIRFYQIVQFLSLFSFWLFLKGFVDDSGKIWQHLFFISITLAMLNQEVTVTLLPSFLLGFLFFYRQINLVKDFSISLSSIFSLAILAYDLIFFTIKCLTPWVALSTTTDSIIKPHILFPTGFLSSLFFGHSRIYTLYSLFFLLGLVYFLIKKNRLIIYLYISFFSNLFLLSILVRQIALRYIYSIYPLFIILSIYSAVLIITDMTKYCELKINQQLPLRTIGCFFLVIILGFNIEPERLLDGYENAISRRNVEIAEYVRDHRKSGDVFISSTPPAAATTLGGLDYYLPGDVFFDVPYWNNGRVLDRWAGGELISNIDQFQNILERSNRVWIYVDEHTESNFSSQELLDYAQTLGKPVFESFAGGLRLWQSDDGYIPSIPNRRRDIGSY